MLHRRRRSSSGGDSSSEEDLPVEDMMIHLKQKQERQSPLNEAKRSPSPNGGKLIEFEINSDLHSVELFSKDDFVEGEKLIDPVTGRTEAKQDESSFAELEKTSVA